MSGWNSAAHGNTDDGSGQGFSEIFVALESVFVVLLVPASAGCRCVLHALTKIIALCCMCWLRNAIAVGEVEALVAREAWGYWCKHGPATLVGLVTTSDVIDMVLV